MASIPVSHEKLWTKNYVLLGLANFLMFVSLQMLIPTLPVYVKDLGASNFIVGLTVSFFAAAAMIIRPFAGLALDRVGRRKILFVGLVCLILASLCYFWTASILLLLMLRVIHGLSWGVSTTSFGTAVSDIVPPSRRGEGIGYFSLSVTLSLATAPYFGVWAMHQLGYTGMFAISSGAGILALIMVQSVKFTDSNGHPTPSGTARQRKLVPFDKQALLPAVLAFLFASTYSSVEAFIVLFAKEKQIDNIGPFFLVVAAMMLIVRPITGKVFDRVGVAWVVLPGISVMIAGMFWLSYSATLPMILIAGGIVGAGLSAVMPALQAWTVNRVSPDRLGAANGTYFSGIDLGFSIGSTVNSAIAGWTSYASMYRIIILYLAIFVVVFLLHLASSAGRSEHKREVPASSL